MGVFDKNKLSQAKTAKTASKKFNILLVDDEEANLKALSRILDKDYQVLTANDGTEALEMVQNYENPENIHLIISDQRMPKMTGLDFFKQVYPIIPKTIRIILTGFTDIDAIIGSINEGKIYKYLTKPIEPVDFKITVKRALEAFELEQQIILETTRLIQEQETLQREVKESFISLLSEEERAWFIKSVKGMMLCKGKIQNSELVYLRTILGFLSNKKEAKRMVEMIKNNEEIDLGNFKMSKDKSLEILDVLLKVAISDGVLSESEIQFFNSSCQKIGFNESFAKKMTHWAHNKVSVDLEHKKLKSISKENGSFKKSEI
jgi:response regulator RpfG family c-di-GMP phosphodiesterase